MTTETNVLERLDVDLDKPIPCYYASTGWECARPATFKMTANPCRHSAEVCDYHMGQMLEVVQMSTVEGIEILCQVLKDGLRHYVDDVEWREL